MSKHPRSARLSRRDTLKACLLPAGVITTRWLVGCSNGTPPASTGAGGEASPSAGGSAPITANVPWATGGTKSIMGGYPDPFGASPGTACAIYPTQTIGPCYANAPMMRSDISDGLDGLPFRMSLLVVRANGCTPVPDATVDIWHSGSNGIYSAYATGTICNPGMENVLAKTFCRGVQTTGANGRVDFDSVFPGWYTGRTIHIHFTLRVAGREYVTSQLYFEDTLSDELLAQGMYAARGKRDTTNTTDGLYLSGGATPSQVLFSWAKRQDGVLHAWKVLSIG